MCGIAGYYQLKQKQQSSRQTLERMISAIGHRGPDGFGFFNQPTAGLAHARLSIVDLDGGWQPIANEDRTLWIVFNGEIFNYPELRDGLLARGHTFRTNSDTEVILHLYEEKGTDCLKDLNGQFAIAIYDTKKQSLFLARDRMGIRPLFYTVHNGTLYFASEIKAIFNADSAIERKMSPTVLTNIFTFWSPSGEETIFSGVRQLLPGHCMEVKESVVHQPSAYWALSFQQDELGFRSEDDYAEELRELLIDSINLRLRADVEVGSYLSGGLDSSVITSLVKHFSNNALKTFSVAFTDSVYDESKEQQEMIDYLQTDHHKLTCSYADIANVFPDVIWHTEIPVLRTAPAPLYQLSKLVRSHNYKVVLTGEGADEIFGGYDIFKEGKIRSFINAQADSEIRPLLLKRLYPYLALSPTKSSAYAQKFFATDANIDDLFYGHRPRWNTARGTHIFLTEHVKEQRRDPFDSLGYMQDDLKGLNAFERSQYLECKLLLANYLLSSQGDRMCMANSVEGRYPFLDHRLVEFAGRIPVQYKMKCLNEKHILKKAMQNLLPASIVKRKKQPYMAPDIQSFFGESSPEYLEYYLSEDLLLEAGLFKPAAVRQLMKKCRKKGRQGFKENMAFIGILSSQIVYEKFCKNFKIESALNMQNVRVACE